jgi:hypothetical protein
LFHVSEFPPVAVPVETAEVKNPVEGSEDAKKQAVLEAHEALAKADAANAVKFRDVIDFLRQELGGETNKEDGTSES